MNINQDIQRHRTAIRRNQLSRPVALALQDRVLATDDTFFDYGCGHGEDVHYLRSMGFRASGWDPVHCPAGRFQPADAVNLGYVINVIEDPEERTETLRAAFALARKVLIVSAMVGHRERAVANATPFRDGHLTQRGTFQRYFDQEELADYLATATGAHPYAAGLGVFYLFRDSAAEDAFCRRLLEDPDANLRKTMAAGRAKLDPLVLQRVVARIDEAGRLLEPDEWPEERVALGLLCCADDWIKALDGLMTRQRQNALRRLRRRELLQTLAASYFSPSGKARLSDLSLTQRADVRSVFGSLLRAFIETEDFLTKLLEPDQVYELCRSWNRGKLTPSALYLHRSQEEALPFELACLARCGKALLADLAGDYSVVKISYRRVGVSLALYEEFDTVAHPRLLRASRADLETSRTAVRDYVGAPNPPVLHRKDALVGFEHPSFELFSQLSRQEDEAGLLGRRDIGTAAGWTAALRRAGYQIEAHCLVPTESGPMGVDEPEDAVPEEDEEDFIVDIDFGASPQLRPGRARPRPARRKWSDRQLRLLGQAVGTLGRRPLPDEIRGVGAATVQKFLKLGDWQTLLGPWFDGEAYERVRKARWSDWIVSLGAARFGITGRLPFRRLARGQQADIKALFGSYRQACLEADRWLLRIGDSSDIRQSLLSWPFGRHHEEKGLYVHESLEPELPVLVRLLLACGRYLARDALPRRTDVIRVAAGGENVKFYRYERFEEPVASRLLEFTKVDFRRRRVIARNHQDDAHPRMLRRKDDLVRSDHPRYAEFLMLTEAVDRRAPDGAVLQEFRSRPPEMAT